MKTSENEFSAVRIEPKRLSKTVMPSVWRRVIELNSV